MTIYRVFQKERYVLWDTNSELYVGKNVIHTSGNALYVNYGFCKIYYV